MAKVTSAVGIDIGTKTIKVAELKASKDRPILTGIGIAPTPPGTVDHSGVLDPGGLGLTIKKLLQESGITTKNAVLGISGQSSLIVRILEVPKMTPGELKDHMQWEIQRNIPFADTQIVSDYKPILRPDTPPDAQNMEVVLGVAQQDAVDRLIAVSKAAGLTPIGIDVESLALGRSLIMNHPEIYGDKTICIINIGETSTTVDVFRNCLLSFTRILPTGGKQLTEAIRQRMGVLDEKAEALKHEKLKIMMEQFGSTPTTQTYDGRPPEGAETYGSFNPFADSTTSFTPEFDLGTTNYQDPSQLEPEAVPVLPGYEDYTAPDYQGQTDTEPVQQTVDEEEQERINVFHSVSRDVEELVADIRRSIEYYLQRAPSAKVDQVLLCGGSASIPNFDEYISLATGLPVAAADPIRGVIIGVKRYPEEYIMQNARLLPVAIGMAMHPFVE